MRIAFYKNNLYWSTLAHRTYGSLSCLLSQSFEEAVFLLDFKYRAFFFSWNTAVELNGLEADEPWFPRTPAFPQRIEQERCSNVVLGLLLHIFVRLLVSSGRWLAAWSLHPPAKSWTMHRVRRTSKKTASSSRVAHMDPWSLHGLLAWITAVEWRLKTNTLLSNQTKWKYSL